MKLRIYFAFLMSVVTAVCGVAFGFTSDTFLMGAALTVAHLLVAFVPRNTLRTSHGVGMVGCDTDAVEAIEALSKEVKESRAQLKKQQDDLREAHATILDKVDKGLKLDAETQANIDKAISEANDNTLVVKELMQQLDEVKKAHAENTRAPITLRSAMLKELTGAHKDGYERLVKKESRSFRMTMKDIDSGSVSTGMKREPHIDSLVSLERQPLRIRDLLTVVPVQSDAVKFGVQTLRDNKAKIVAEGTSKPYSNYKWEDDTAVIETVAHLAKLTLQAIADAPRLVAEVESEMRYGYRLVEENEILNGDGTTGHLSGLRHNSTAYALPVGMDGSNVLTGVDRMRVAILQIHLAYAIPDGHVLNPINLAEIDLERRDPDKGGGYLYSRPDGDTGVARIWRLPVVESPSMLVNEFLTGAFKYSAHLYDRQGITVALSMENDTDFEDNKATMRVEGRLGLGVRRPYGLVTGRLKNGS